VPGIIVPQNQSALNLKQHTGFFKKIQDRDLKKSRLPELLVTTEKSSLPRRVGCSSGRWNSPLGIVEFIRQFDFGYGDYNKTTLS
jgi:hypothetical protein